jgi:hypothetical protein
MVTTTYPITLNPGFTTFVANCPATARNVVSAGLDLPPIVSLRSSRPLSTSQWTVQFQGDGTTTGLVATLYVTCANLPWETAAPCGAAPPRLVVWFGRS